MSATGADDKDPDMLDDGDLSGEDDMGDDQDDQPPGSGPYATLHTDGAQNSLGSGGHPEGCTPCTFYCFTRRGCNRGLECGFCHLTHQSKLQQRREAWKKQQREKRKSIRERVAQEASSRRHNVPGSEDGSSMADGPPAPAPRRGSGTVGPFETQSPGITAMKSAVAAYGIPSSGGAQRRPNGPGNSDSKAASTAAAVAVAAAAGSMTREAGVGMAASGFAYNPPRAVFTIGQDVEMLPQLVAVPVQFRVVGPMPQGLILDQVSGIIRGAPSIASPQKAIVIEADLLGGRTVRAAVEIEVIDFTRGGFVIGHMSEVEPGKFCLLLYVPEENSSQTNDERGYQLGDINNSGPKLGGANGGRLNVSKNSGEQKPFYPGAGSIQQGSKAMTGPGRLGMGPSQQQQQQQQQPSHQAQQAQQQDWW